VKLLLILTSPLWVPFVLVSSVILFAAWLAFCFLDEVTYK